MSWSDTRFEPVDLAPTAEQAFADVNIEVAHVSASLAGGDWNLGEIGGCMRRYKHIVRSLEYGVSSSSETTMCLVDDYNHLRPANFSEMLTRHVNQVESFGACIDYIVFESVLEVLKDEFLDLNHDQGIVRYMQKNGRSPCSAHIAMWYLARLGKLTTALPAFRRITSVGRPFFAQQLLSILPRYYDTFEERATIVLGRSAMPDVVGQINHAYFDADPPGNLEYYAEVG